MKTIIAVLLLGSLVGCAQSAPVSDPVTKLEWECAPAGTAASLRCVPKSGPKARQPSNELAHFPSDEAKVVEGK